MNDAAPPLRNSLGVISRPAMNRITIAAISPICLRVIYTMKLLHEEIHFQWPILLSYLLSQSIRDSTEVLLLKMVLFIYHFKNNIILIRKLVNIPLLIEVIDKKANLEPYYPHIKRMVSDNGLIALQES
jgi:hypothetical protein